VLDRFHLGERVYPQLKNDGRVPLERWQQHEIERVLLSSGTILIRCEATLGFMKHVHETRGETFITVDDIPREVALFCDAFNNSILPVVHMLLGTQDEVNIKVSVANRLQSVVRDISRKWFETKDTNTMGRDFQGAGNIGQWGQPIMLVGERYADGTYVDDSFDHRALCGDRNGSAFLHRALDEMPALAPNVYITNLWKHHDIDRNEDDLRREREMLRPTAIVALGKKVDRQLAAWGIDHKTVNHPQHQARFLFRDLAGYARKIYEAGGFFSMDGDEA